MRVRSLLGFFPVKSLDRDKIPILSSQLWLRQSHFPGECHVSWRCGAVYGSSVFCLFWPYFWPLSWQGTVTFTEDALHLPAPASRCHTWENTDLLRVIYTLIYPPHSLLVCVVETSVRFTHKVWDLTTHVVFNRVSDEVCKFQVILGLFEIYNILSEKEGMIMQIKIIIYI